MYRLSFSYRKLLETLSRKALSKVGAATPHGTMKVSEKNINGLG
jgi:hypothetical protein